MTPLALCKTYEGNYPEVIFDLHFRLEVDSSGPQRLIYQASDMFSDKKTWIPDTFMIENPSDFLPSNPNGRSFLRLHSDGYFKTSLQ